jgi:hypothetical protein
MNEYKLSIRNFLIYAQKCVVHDAVEIRSIIETGKPYVGINEIYFLIDAVLSNYQTEATRALRKKHSSSIISDEEIQTLLYKNAAAQFYDNKDKSDEVLKSLAALTDTNIKFIAPNHAIRLIGLSNFDIGPVKCQLSKDLVSDYPHLFSNQKLVIDEEKRGNVITDKTIKFHLSSQCFIISLKCSPKKAENLAQWYIDIALSLLRLYLFKHKSTYGFFPYVGYLDPLPFQKREMNSHFIKIENGKSTGYGMTNHPAYELHQQTANLLAQDNFFQACTAIFEAKENTTTERLQRALGWMTKARQSTDLATKFLFFFTALEALLTFNNDAPVTDTIARNSATIIGEIESRHLIYKELKKLYKLRSSLVHHGDRRDVSETDCDKLQVYTEMMCWKILDNAIDQNLEDFQKDLKIAGFGTKWPFITNDVKTE